MSLVHLEKLFRPNAVAVIGASLDAQDLGYVVLRGLLGGAFHGPVFPVNPSYRSLNGVWCYESLAALPVVPDLAVLCTPPRTIPSLVEELGKRGTRAAIVLTADPEGDGRYPETGFKKALLDAAKPSGLRVLGPGSTGIQVPGIALNASWIATAAKPGRLAMVSQSGSLIAGVMEWAAARGIGFSHVISAGDAADIDIADLLDYLAADAAARAILLYVRSIQESRKFLSAARAAARAKPVIVLKAGRRLGADGAEVTALAPDEVFDAAIRRAGMLRVYDIDELFDAVQTLACVRLQGWQGGESLAILCNGSGPGEIAADRLVAGGGRLAPLSAATEAALAALIPGGWRGGDPVDLGRDALPSRFAEAAALLLRDDCVDALLVMHTPTARAAAAATAEAVTRVAREYKRTVLACWLGLGLGDADKAAIRNLFAEAHIPVYRTPEKAARGFLHLIRYHRNQEMLLQTPALPPAGTRAANRSGHATIVAALQQGCGVLDDAAAGELLAAYGIERAADRAGGLPLTAGMVVDPIFGPVIRFGLGGALSQLVGDRALALPPLNLTLARELVSRTRIGRSILTAERAPLVAVEPLLVLLVQLSQMVIDIPEIAALSFDPLLADRERVWAGQARIVVKPVPAAGRRLAICPYPRECEEVVRARNGQEILIRPIRPEDAPAYQLMIERLDPKDMEMRFWAAFKGLPRAQLADLIHIDYDRDMSFVAVVRGAGETPEIVGMINLLLSPKTQKAEYGVVIRSDQKGRGLGRLLMEKIVRYARDRQIGEICGFARRDNEAMLTLCAKLGFAIQETDDDFVEVHLDVSHPEVSKLANMTE